MNEIVFEVDNAVLQQVSSLVLKANFDEVKKSLAEIVEPYKSVIVTDDAIAVSRTDRARLRKIKTSIDDYRKTVKKVYSAPLTVFEGKCKELTDICDEGIENLDSQVKDYEAKQKAEKNRIISEKYRELAEGYTEYLPLAEIANDKWLNKTYPIEDITAEITAAVNRVKAEIESIKALSEVHAGQLLDRYRQTHSITEVINFHNALREAEKRAEENARKQAELEAQKRQAELEAELRRKAEEQIAQAKAELEKDIVVQKYDTEEPVVEIPVEADPEELQQWVTVEVCVTPTQFGELKKMLDRCGIKFTVQGRWFE